MQALGLATLNILWFLSEFPGFVGTLKYSKSAFFHVLSNPSFIIDLTLYVEKEEQETNDTETLEHGHSAVYKIPRHNEEQEATQ
jgi:hypothetical protein